MVTMRDLLIPHETPSEENCLNILNRSNRFKLNRIKRVDQMMFIDKLHIAMYVVNIQLAK